MAVTVAPSVEASEAILDRIRTGTAYSRLFIAKRPDQAVDVLEDIVGLQVDVVHDTEVQLNGFNGAGVFQRRRRPRRILRS